jgi:RNA polymerase sigma factor (sigma-70 family)
MAAIEKSVRAAAALDDLYRRHVGDVYRYTYAVLGNHADAEDVTQTTFVNALRALERGEEPQNPSNWLLVIAHNIVRQRWRQAAARPAEVELIHDVPDAAPDDDIELDSLVRALQRIPPAQREALVMRELEGRSYQEIADLLGLTTSALETLLFRARRSLAEELENVVTCQTAELAMSQRLDGRLSRKDRRRLDEHLAECVACTKMSQSQARQRKAFKGLAVLPLPIGLALFKDVPTAAAASLPTIGGVSSSGGATTGVGAATAGAGGAATGGGVAVGGSLLGAAALKVAAVVVAGVVLGGTAYEAAKIVRGDSGDPAAAKQQSQVKGAFANGKPGPQPSAVQAAPSTGVSRRASSATDGNADGTQSSPAEASGGAQAPSSSGAIEEPTTPAGGGQDSGGQAGGAQDPAGPSAGAPEPGSTPPASGPEPAGPTPPTSPGNGGSGGSGGSGGTAPQAPGAPPATPGAADGGSGSGTAGVPGGGTTTTPTVKKAKKPKKPKKATPGEGRGNDKPKSNDAPKGQDAPTPDDGAKPKEQPKPRDDAGAKARGTRASDQSGANGGAATPSASPPVETPAAATEPAPPPAPPSSESDGTDADKHGNANGHDKNGK